MFIVEDLSPEDFESCHVQIFSFLTKPGCIWEVWDSQALLSLQESHRNREEKKSKYKISSMFFSPSSRELCSSPSVLTQLRALG